jgi:hypothetical protein
MNKAEYTKFQISHYDDVNNWTEAESQHINKTCKVYAQIRNGQWEPVTYDLYDEKSGKWSFKNTWGCIHRTQYVRHVVTGKMYRYNQTIRIFRHELDQKAAA